MLVCRILVCIKPDVLGKLIWAYRPQLFPWIGDITFSRQLLVAADVADTPLDIPTRKLLDSRPLVGYVGSLFKGKGVELIVDIARLLPNVEFLIVGGDEEQIANYKQKNLTDNSANVCIAAFTYGQGQSSCTQSRDNVWLKIMDQHQNRVSRG